VEAVVDEEDVHAGEEKVKPTRVVDNATLHQCMPPRTQGRRTAWRRTAPWNTIDRYNMLGDWILGRRATASRRRGHSLGMGDEPADRERGVAAWVCAVVHVRL
jgi:hypothetical protein